jgi:hypothetical protein
LRRLLKSSYFVTHLLDRFEPKYWLGLSDEVGNNPVNVACQLLQDLERQATAAQIQFFVVTQYYDQEIINSNSEMPKLTNCLRNTPVKIIDTFSAIKSRERNLYTLYFGSLTHMTGPGTESSPPPLRPPSPINRPYKSINYLKRGRTAALLDALHVVVATSIGLSPW